MFMSFNHPSCKDAVYLQGLAGRLPKPMSGEADHHLQAGDNVDSAPRTAPELRTSASEKLRRDSVEGSGSTSRTLPRYHATAPYPTFRRPSGPVRSRQESSSSSSSSSNPAILPGPRSAPLRQGESSSTKSTSSASSRQIRLPPLSSFAGDLPEFTYFSPQPPTSSPVRPSRSNQSRGSVSSRGSGSSPRSFSSGSSRFRTGPGFSSQDNPNTLRSSTEAPDFHYELLIRQQPGRAAAAGLSPSALSRLPVVASPILRLRVTDQSGREVPHQHIVQALPYLVCSCSLISAEEEGTGPQAPVDFVRQQEGDGDTGAPAQSSNPPAMLCGTRVYSAVEAVDMDGEAALFFIFWDVSVRQIGRYRLKFSLVEALPGSPTMTTTLSDAFDVVQLAEFPGITEIATDMSKHFHRQGLSVCQLFRVPFHDKIADLEVPKQIFLHSPS